MYFEVRSMARDKAHYLKDIYNYIDISSFVLNLYILSYSSQALTKAEEAELQLGNLCCLAVIIMWYKSFYWLRLFDNTSFYVRLIADTLFEVRYFMILFVMILMTFGNAIFILSRSRENPLYKDYLTSEYINVLLNQYEMALGTWNT